MDIFEEIDIKIKSNDLNESNIVIFADSISDKLKQYVHDLSRTAYNENFDKLKLLSFQSEAKEKIIKVLKDFYFRFEHWKQNRKFEPYLKSSLINLAKSIHNSSNALNIEKMEICPACKNDGQIVYLEKENNLLRCHDCSKFIENSKNISNIEDKLRFKIKEIYQLHSKKGYYCIDCKRFLPESMVIGDIITCPFLDCFFSDSIFNLEMTYYHPMMSMIRKTNLIIEFNEHSNAQQPIAENSIIFYDQIKIIKNIFNDEKKRIKKFSLSSSIKKISLIEAFEDVFDQFIEEMIPYLVDDKRSALPLQSFIFQKYANILESKLPFTFGKKEIFDILDQDLGLFLGISTYQTQINDDKISNKTKEHFISNRNKKDNGPCYIGKLLELKNSNGDDLMNEIDYYSFSEITLKTREHHGKTVNVTHYRIPSHYQMGDLVFLQQIRKTLGSKIKSKIKNDK